MCDSAFTLAESDKESQRAFLTLESSTGLGSSSSEALRRNPV